jgi:hypothetical protein
MKQASMTMNFVICIVTQYYQDSEIKGLLSTMGETKNAYRILVRNWHLEDREGDNRIIF